MNAEDFADLPEVMRAARRWIVWKAIPVSGKKPRKVPYYTNGKTRTRTDTPEDAAQLAMFEDAVRALQTDQYAGLGFALGPDGTGRHWQGIDLDGLSAHAHLQEVADDLPGYTETSPSGDGKHAIGYGRDFAALASNSSGLEAYAHGRFFTVTADCAGLHDPCDLADFVRERVAPLHAMHGPCAAPPAPAAPGAVGFIDPQRLTDLRAALLFVPADDYDTWLKVGMALHSTQAPEAFGLWTEWSQRSAKFDPGDQGKKWASFKQRADGVHVETIFTLAHKAGWKGSGAASRAKSPADELSLFADTDEHPDLSHDSLALRMGAQGGWNDRARYVAGWGAWLFWNGALWAKDEKLRHMTECRDFLRRAANDLQQWAEKRAEGVKPEEGDALKRWAKREARILRSEPTRNNVETTARSNPELVASANQFDANLDVIGTPGGVVDLRTGALRPAMREDYLTRAVAIAPADREPSRWLAFLHESMDGDTEMIDFLQRLCGYALTGRTSEHKLPFLFGSGANGKSVFANTLHDLFGGYAKRAPAEAFLQARGERHPTDLAGLDGARLVIGSELPAARAWNESVIKDLTGGDSITARFMRMDFFTYRPQFSLLIVGNHMPAIGSVDDAMRRRILLIPFTRAVPPEKRDKQLQTKLRDEWPGILQWAIEGAVAWYRDGLQVPGKVTGASKDYLDAEDVLGQFMAECLEQDHTAGGAPSGETHATYTAWMERRRQHPMSQRAFTQALRERGVTVKAFRDVARLVGWRLCQPAPVSAVQTYKPWMREA